MGDRTILKAYPMSIEITFGKSAVEPVLDEFDKTVDDDGLVVEQDTGNPVLTQSGNELRVENVGGIANGSEIYIENNFVSILEYVESRNRSDD
jgi:hypothetical protein